MLLGIPRGIMRDTLPQCRTFHNLRECGILQDYPAGIIPNNPWHCGLRSRNPTFFPICGMLRDYSAGSHPTNFLNLLPYAGFHKYDFDGHLKTKTVIVQSSLVNTGHERCVSKAPCINCQ